MRSPRTIETEIIAHVPVCACASADALAKYPEDGLGPTRGSGKEVDLPPRRWGDRRWTPSIRLGLRMQGNALTKQQEDHRGLNIVVSYFIGASMKIKHSRRQKRGRALLGTPYRVDIAVY